jgi:hypothetical protein
MNDVEVIPGLIDAQPIPRIDRPSDDDLCRRLSLGREPFIFSGRIAHWPASAWTPEAISAKTGDTVTEPLVDLPRIGTPYFWNDRRYGQSMRVAELVERMGRTPESQCYLAQKSIDRFPGLTGDFNFADILTGQSDRAPSTSFWMGTRGTHSGLHFDRRDNVLAQINGHKYVVLAAPEEARRLHPIPDMFEKSSVDPMHPDLRRYPLFRKARLLHAIIGPGDVVYIPRLEWHYLESLDTSISLNHWFGNECSVKDLAVMMTRGGLAVCARVLRDAFWYGLCHRPYQTRLRSDMPSGVFMYKVVSDGIRRRLHREPPSQ